MNNLFIRKETVNNCPICNEDKIKTYPTIGDYFDIDCAVCGRYQITRSLALTFSGYSNKYLISGFLRNKDNKEEIFKLTTYNIETTLKISTPRNVLEKADHLLLFINERIQFGGQRFQIMSEMDYPIAYCRNAGELNYILENLIKIGYLETTEDLYYDITFKGYERIREIRKFFIKNDQCFIAMSFAPELNDIFENGLSKGISEANYKVMRVDKEQHNDKVDDKIISEIRKSSLLVADVTLHRQGVYFEAGFAMGLGIPVIWTCRETDINDAHFDTRQYNHILWKGAEDLREQLFNRIQALYPR